MTEQAVLKETTSELTAMFRVAAQLGRWLADRRRQTLHQAQVASERQRQAVQAAIESERRLAEPVYRRALDSRFWDQASQQEAAFVYGLATRFATLDPTAHLAAHRCEQEAGERWGADLQVGESEHASAHPVTSQQVDHRTVEAVAPALDGEKDRDWRTAVDESAHANLAETTAADGAEQQARDTETAMSALAVVVDQAPEVAQVRSTRSKDSLVFTALDGGGDELEAVSRALNQAQQDAVAQSLVAQRLGGRLLNRDEFLTVTSTPLMRAAVGPAAGQQDTGPAEDTRSEDDALARDETARHAPSATQGQPAPDAGWDSQEARDRWARRQLDAGLPADAVRAARTGDMTMHAPPSTASASTAPSTRGRRPSAPRQARASKRAR